MYILDRAEFYITNVCNLNCTDCNRFNNFAFKGHERWQEYQAQYRQWAQVLDLKNTDIIGGEPMANPDFMCWVEGIAELWPRSKITVWTNGHYLDRWHELKNIDKKIGKKVNVCIAGHHADDFVNEINKVVEWLGTCSITIDYDPLVWQQRYSQSRQPHWPDCDDPKDFWRLPNDIQQDCIKIHRIHPQQLFMTKFISDHGVIVEYFCNIYFYQASLRYQNNQFQWHNSDPEKAYQSCYLKTCPHFSKGKFFKCGIVGTMIDFVDQFEVPVPDHARTLIDSYVPADPTWNQQDLYSFLDNIKFQKSIPNCRLCPEKMTTGDVLLSTTKKIKLVRKNS